MITGILTSFTDPKSTCGVLIRMVCSLFLAIVIIEPFSHLKLSYLTAFAENCEEVSQTAASMGTKLADDARREIIKAEAEAYILDKAGSYGLQLYVCVTLCEDDIPVPESVCLTGAVSPYARTKLEMLIEDELGIPKERQLWTG